MDNKREEKETNLIENRNGRKLLQHWQQVSVYLVAYDVVAVTMAYFLALLLRFDFKFSAIPLIYLQPWKLFAPLYAVVCLIIFRSLKLYRSIWRFASFTELIRITYASFITSILHIAGVTIVLNILASDTEYRMTRMPFSYYIIGSLLQFVLVVAIRFSYRLILLMRAARANKDASRVMLIGMSNIIRVT